MWVQNTCGKAMGPIVFCWWYRCAKSNKLPVEPLPLAATDAASHLKSTDLHLPMREAARVNYHCWTLSLLRASGHLGRRDTPVKLPHSPRSQKQRTGFTPLVCFLFCSCPIHTTGNSSLDSNNFFQCRKDRKNMAFYNIPRPPPK